MDSLSTRRLYALAALILIVGSATFGLYEYNTSQGLEAEVAGIKNQVATLTQSSSTASGNSLPKAVAQVTPAVVSIVISKEVPQIQVHYSNHFGIRIPSFNNIGSQLEEVGAGSGFFVRSDGYILTNRHVVEDPSATYTVFLSNNTEKPAKVVYLDPNTDLALVKIDGIDYPTVQFGDSTELALGDTVAAIGNALGEYSNTVSTGIISGLNRTVQAEDLNGSTETLSGVIQTDAAINLGNSGGPLIDLTGKVVGINVATILGSNSIAFAIPSKMATTLLASILPPRQ